MEQVNRLTLTGQVIQQILDAVNEKLKDGHLAEASNANSGLMSAGDKRSLDDAVRVLSTLLLNSYTTKDADKHTYNAAYINAIAERVALAYSLAISASTKVDEKEEKTAHSKDLEVVNFRLDIAEDSIDTNILLINSIARQLGDKVPMSRKVNGKSMYGDITLYGSDLRISPEDQRSISQGKANLNSQGVLATGEEQRLVVQFLQEGMFPMREGVYYVPSNKRIVTLNAQGVTTLSEIPSQNVIYCAKNGNTLYRWDGSTMVQVGGGSVDAYTKAESDKLLKGKVDVSRKVNGKTLDADISISGKDIPYGSGSNTIYQAFEDLSVSLRENFDDIESRFEDVNDLIGNVEQLLASI